MNQNNELKTELSEYLKQVLFDFKASRSFLKLPEKWLIDETGLIDWMVEEVEELEWLVYQELALSSIAALEFLKKKYPEIKPITVDRGPTIDWVDLVDLARKKKYEDILKLAEQGYLGSIIIGYWLILELAQQALDFYSNKHPNEKAAIYIKNAKLLKEYGYTEDLSNAYFRLTSNRLRHKAENHFDLLSVNQREKIEHGYDALYKVLDEYLKNLSIDEQIEKAITGDVDLKYLPRKAFLRQKDIYKKEKKYRKRNLSIDINVKDDSGDTLKDLIKSGFTEDQLLENLDNTRLIAIYIDFLNQIGILTPREKQVLTMRYPLNGDTRPYTLEETAKVLGIKTKQTIHEIEKNALKKVKKQLRNYRT